MSVEHIPMYPSSTLEAASRRISAIYENIIFGDEGEEEGDTQVVEEDLTRDAQGKAMFPLTISP